MKKFFSKNFYIPLLFLLYILTAALNFLYQPSQHEMRGSLVDGEVQTNVSEPPTEMLTEKEQADCKDKKVVLSFDDGPGPYTQKLLEELKKRDVKANFFVVGKNICEYQDVLVQMAKDGHLIGNHTYTHVQLNQLSEAEAKKEIEQTNELIEKLTGIRPDFIRPPYGEYSEVLRRDIDMFVALWNVDPLDWKRTDVDGMVQKVLQEIQPGDVILFHDIYETSVQAVLLIVDELLKQGYQFITMEELIF